MHDTDEIMDSLDEVFGVEDEDGDQTDFAEEADTPETEPKEHPQEVADGPEPEDNLEYVESQEMDETPAEGEQNLEEEAPQNPQQFITVKYDSETRQVSMEDALGLIQKGMNYDRMLEKLDTAKQEHQQEQQKLQAKIDEQTEALSTLEMIAQVVGTSVPEMLEQLHVNAYKGTGKTEAEARAIIKADKLERQLKSQGKTSRQETSPEDAKTQKVTRELTEFRKQYPNVNLEDPDLVERLRPHIQSGMDLTTAYLKQENERQAAEIVRLQQEQVQKQAAQEKNKKNRTTTPGSMQDSGGGRTKDLADLFEEELFR